MLIILNGKIVLELYDVQLYQRTQEDTSASLLLQPQSIALVFRGLGGRAINKLSAKVLLWPCLQICI